MSVNCEACEELKVNAASFVNNGVTTTICNSMAADTGLNPSLSPKHTDAADLHKVNDCLIGKMGDDIESYNVCEWQDFMHKFMSNLHELLKLMICAMGGIWTKIHNHDTRIGTLESDMTGVKNRLTAVENTVSGLSTTVGNLSSTVTTLGNTVNGYSTSITNLQNSVGTLTTNYNKLKNVVDQLVEALSGSSNKVTVVRKYSYTVPVNKFIHTWEADCTSEGGSPTHVTAWFSGATGIECYISIPVTEMETVVGVWAQPYVVPGGNDFDGVGKDFMETVAVQTWTQQGSNIIVNFDTYELAPPRVESGGVVTTNGGPYPVKVDFLVVGTKTITPI